MPSYINTCSFKNYFLKIISQSVVAGHKSWIIQNLYTTKCMNLPKEQREAELCFLIFSLRGSWSFWNPVPLSSGEQDRASGCVNIVSIGRGSHEEMRVVGPGHRPRGELEHTRLCCPRPARRTCASGSAQGRSVPTHCLSQAHCPGRSVPPESTFCTWRPRVNHWPWSAYCCDPH